MLSTNVPFLKVLRIPPSDSLWPPGRRRVIQILENCKWSKLPSSSLAIAQSGEEIIQQNINFSLYAVYFRANGEVKSKGVWLCNAITLPSSPRLHAMLASDKISNKCIEAANWQLCTVWLFDCFRPLEESDLANAPQHSALNWARMCKSAGKNPASRHADIVLTN